jgi:ABC-type multidrug transport system ATPase subunit
MTSEIDTSADKVRNDLKADVNLGSNSLIEFASRFAIDVALKHESMILKINYAKSKSKEDRNTVQQQMIELVKRIVTDYKTSSEESIKDRKKVLDILAKLSHRDIDRSTIFCCNNLGYRYKRSRFGLRSVNLDLRLGEVTGLVGENASGKTTLMRLVVGDLKHTEGSLSYPALQSNSTTSIDWALVKTQISYVPQSLPDWHGSLETNLRYEAAIHGITGEANDGAFDYIVERLDLRNFLDRSWHQLSDGYKLRFALARALISRPKLLALDEPLANLDFRSQLTLLRDIRYLASSFREPMAVIISSQHLHEIEGIADNVIFLNDGLSTYSGPIRKIGADRTHNVFEVASHRSNSELQKFLNMPFIDRSYYNGLCYVVTVSRSVDSTYFLRELIAHNVDVDYFRDISQSVRSLFEDAA